MTYYKISNADGKQWIMPSQNMSIGLLLYQPSAWKGKLLTRWFPLVSKFDWFGIIKKALHIEMCECPVSAALESRLCQIFGRDDLEYSVFNGTPCAHQKTTIQVYVGDKILGYCKITDKPELIDIFKREEKFLQWMNEKGVTSIPRCLCCEELYGEWIFVQTTTKSRNSRVRHSIGDIEMNMLEDISAKTISIQRFEDTDQYKWMKTLEDNIHTFSSAETSILSSAIEKIKAYYAKQAQCAFSAYHSDFTPWNMFEENGELFVFDWEYAGRSYMPFLDLIHYMIQSSVFEGKLDAKGIYAILFNQNERLLRIYFDDMKIAVLVYLVDIITKFAIRDAGRETVDSRTIKDTRIQLAGMILNE